MLKKLIILLILNTILFSEDTLHLKSEVVLLNVNTKQIPLFQNIKLKSSDFLFEGYLVIKINNNTKLDTANISIGLPDVLQTEIYWTTSLSDSDSFDNYQYSSAFESIISYFSNEYETTINKITAFSKYYKSFNADNNCKSYLYKGNKQITTNDIINSRVIFENESDLGSFFIIYKCKFKTAILEYIYPNKSSFVLLPISDIMIFENVTDVELSNHSFKKSNVTLIVN